MQTLQIPTGRSPTRLPSQSQLERSPRRAIPHVVEGEVTFVGRGNPTPSKYYIVPQNLDVAEFADTCFANKDLPRPQVLISVTGGAQDFKMLSSNLEQIFNRGLLRAAANTSAWIVTGGLSTGVMEFVGNALRQMDVSVPCIGIATYSKVSHKECLELGSKVSYSAEKKNDNKSASLQQDHTHFILVRSAIDDWGQEIEFRTALEHHFATKDKIPIVLVALNGGPNTIKTLVEGARKGFPIIIVDKSGRACDAMVSFLKYKLDNKRHKPDAWNQFISATKDPPKQAEYTEQMEELYLYRDRIIIFNPSENSAEDMDKVILRSVMKLKDTNFYGKMELCVQWGRADMIEELLQQEDAIATTQQKADAINLSLQKALLLDKPEIYELLIKKGADKDSINLGDLYSLEDVKFHIDRLKPFAGISSRSIFTSTIITETSPLIGSSAMITWHRFAQSAAYDESAMDVARKVFHSINEIYSRLLDDKQVTFTDALVWAIVVDRPALAKAIWRNMECPIHSSLLACHLYSVLSEWFQGEEVYQECRDWFENEAIAVLCEANYDHAIPILTWKWDELNDFNALQLAELAECKEFTAHPYVQRFLNKKQYYDLQGHILPGTPMWKITMLAICPLLIPFVGTYVYENNPKCRPTWFYHFYNLPIVKIITCTLCYILFLALLTLNVLECIPGKFDIEWYEIFLWIWVFAMMIEEGVQYSQDRANHFDALSNQMDLFMNLGLVAYIVLRLIAWGTHSQDLVEAYTNVLVISNVMCYVRLMNVFAVSKSLGPLFFVIMRLFKDVVKWSFIFVVFAISFQIAIFALTREAYKNPWETYPNGTLGVGLTIIIGQQGDNTMEYMQATNIGVFLISVYSLISQVMLVNLLIAMMGDTYSNVKANSDKEWKFYRYGLITEFMSTSPYPPPFNLILGPIFYIKHKMNPTSDPEELPSPLTVVHMKIAKDKTIDKERVLERDSLPSLSTFIRESTRLSFNQFDGDRLFMEYNMKSLHTTIEAQRKTIENLQLALVSQERSLETLHSKFDTLIQRLKVD